jgi:hypothetical protein
MENQMIYRHSQVTIKRYFRNVEHLVKIEEQPSIDDHLNRWADKGWRLEGATEVSRDTNYYSEDSYTFFWSKES